MSILTVLRKGVKVANKVTRSVQGTIQYQQYQSSDVVGTKIYVTSAPIPLQVIAEYKQQQVRTKDGIMSVSRSSVLFLDVAALFAATGGLGVNDNDLIVMPDGTTGPILSKSGFVDAGTGQPLATQIYLG